jgi:hypothetical protein
MVNGEEVIPSKEESDAGSVSHFTPPDLSKTLNANPPLFILTVNHPVAGHVTQS